MERDSSFAKHFLFFVNLIVALSGLAMISIVLLNWQTVLELRQLGYLILSPWVCISVGAFMFFIALFSCYGYLKQSYCMVVTYGIFLLVTAILQVVLVMLMFTYADRIKVFLGNSVHHLFIYLQINDYESSAISVINLIQKRLQCCGRFGPYDYAELGITGLPQSCCNNVDFISATPYESCTIDNIYEMGCVQRIMDFCQNWKIMAGVAMAFAGVEVVGALCSLRLANAIRNANRKGHNTSKYVVNSN